MREIADVYVSGSGTLYVLHAATERAQLWIVERVSEDGYNPQYPEWLNVEHRYVRDIVNAMIADGLKVAR